MSMTVIPWLLAVITAVWFGLMARQARRNWALWGLGGAVFGLVTSTIVFGLGHASCIPFSDHDRAVLHTEWATAAVGVIAVVGWLFTLGLHRHDRALWKLFAKPGPPAQISSPKPPEAKAPAPKPSDAKLPSAKPPAARP